MYNLREDASIEAHCEDLVFLSSALEIAEEDGELSGALLGKAAEVDVLVAEGDTLTQQITQAIRAQQRTSARVKRADTVQERALFSLWSDCMTRAKMNREAPLVSGLFEGGPAKLLRAALERQTDETRVVIGKLESQDAYAGELRAAHVPALGATVDRAEQVLARREADTRALEALYARAQEWKARGNALRASIGGLLMAHGATRGEGSPKQYARDFFGR